MAEIKKLNFGEEFDSKLIGFFPTRHLDMYVFAFKNGYGCILQIDVDSLDTDILTGKITEIKFSDDNKSLDMFNVSRRYFLQPQPFEGIEKAIELMNVVKDSEVKE